jgi:nucleoside-diphosphate-sugar epimerase
MKLFVTGGTGFVGSHVINRCHEVGHEVVALRRPGSQPRVSLRREPEWIEQELDTDLGAAFNGVDAVIHLASHTPNPPYDTLERCLYWNVYAALRMARQATAAGVRRFLVAGSCFEYGSAAAGLDRIPTDAALEPALSYPTSKAAASVAFMGLAREQGLVLEVLRLFQVYGEGEQSSRFWPTLRRAALAGSDFQMSPGEQVRDFVEVGEVARQIVAALAFHGPAAAQPRVRHVGTGQAQTLLDFATHWWHHWGASGRLIVGAVPYRPNEIMRLVPALDATESP